MERTAIDALVVTGGHPFQAEPFFAVFDALDGVDRVAAEYQGTDYPASGYVFDVAHTVEVLAPAHPVCAGLEPTFTITDELYCFPVAEGSVTPLMRTTFPTAEADRFSSADLAIRGRLGSNEGWHHPPGSDLVAWTKPAGRSQVVYLQFGDGPQTYADPTYRRALHNAITWTAGGT